MSTPHSNSDDRIHAALQALSLPVRLTRWGMWAEALSRAFWPLWVVVGLTVAALSFGLPSVLSQPLLWGLSGAVLSLIVGLLIWGLWRVRLPDSQAAADRLDAQTPGRPVETLRDKMAVGSDDLAAQAVWHAHLARVAEQARNARPVAPDLRLARFDRFGLRLVAATGVGMALLFGGGLRPDQPLLPFGGGPAQATGPAWEGWVEPPRYTGLPSLYLNELPASFDVPQGARLSLRLYDPSGRVTVSETVTGAEGAVDDPAPSQELTVTRSGTLEVTGPQGQRWDIAMAVDMAPSIKVDGPLSRVGAGELRLPFTARDDFAVVGGEAIIALDLAGLDRRYGLAVDPEPREALRVPIPLSVSGSRARFSEVLAEDFSDHPWANLSVTLTLSAEDDLAQVGLSEPLAITLPGRRFFNPMAAALVEQRRDLMWSRENGARVQRLLRAVTYQPQGGRINEPAHAALAQAQARLEAGLVAGLVSGLSTEARDEVAEALWQAALMFEEGSLADAEERLRRAQEALQEAMRRGASEDEIAELMRELREAMEAYIEQRRQEAERNGEEPAPQDENAETLGPDQIQEMMDEIQRLMNEGKMDEAQALLEELMRLMENMQLGEGQGDTAGERAMEELQDSLREQQELSDDAFRELQQGQQGQQEGQQQQGQQPGQSGQPSQGQQGQQGQSGGQNGQGRGAEGTQDGMGLADRQEALGRAVREQRRNLPGAGTEGGDAARQSLERAERAMEDAEDALREGNMAGALNDQSRAIDALRDGVQDLADMIAEAEENGGEAGEEGQGARGEQGPGQDPLGREAGNRGRLGSEDELLKGQDGQARARELLDEIRRRSGEQARPEAERDYLRRLLDQFQE